MFKELWLTVLNLYRSHLNPLTVVTAVVIFHFPPFFVSFSPEFNIAAQM